MSNEQNAAVENAARAIYETWSELDGYSPWIVGGNSNRQNDARALARRIVEAAPRADNAALIAENWILVPIKPTMEMLDAAIDVDSYRLGDISPLGFRQSPQTLFGRCYAAMLTAAPASLLAPPAAAGEYDELIARLRNDGSSWAQSTFNEAADALAAMQARIDALEGALKKIEDAPVSYSAETLGKK